MSRAAIANQLTTPSQHIFITEITQADGTTKKPVISSQPLHYQSIRVNTRDYLVPVHLLMILMQPATLKPNPFILIIHQVAKHFRKLSPEILAHLFSYLFPINQFSELASIGFYATAVRKPILFSQLKINPFFVVDAAMRGQEDIVLNILNTDPVYLLKYAEVENSVGIKSTRTPLQAAMMANDVQLIERMTKHFERLTTDLAGNPIDGLAEMKRQIIAIYKESLGFYFRKRGIAQLTASGRAIDDEALTFIQTQFETVYWQATQERGMKKIIKEYNKAQKQNAFNLQPYIDAIINAPRAQLKDAAALLRAQLQEQEDMDGFHLMVTVANTIGEDRFEANLSQEDWDDLETRTYAKITAEKTAAFTARTAAIVARTGVSSIQTDAARAKPFDQLTLVEKLNRFREAFVEHMRQEIIFNPNHILESLRQHDRILNEIDAGHVIDLNYNISNVIFSQLVGWAQRNAAEPVKQDLRQGAWYLTERNERRQRPPSFNHHSDSDSDSDRNSYPDVSLMNPSVIDGIGYKFAAQTRSWCYHALGMRGLAAGEEEPFQTLCQAKINSWETLLRSLCERLHHPSPSAGV